SDIPGIGRLFRFESEQNTRTELFVILRPVVIDSPEDRDRLMQIESQRMNWCVEDVIDIHGPILEKETLAGETDTVYPDRTPTGYHREAKLQQAPSRESFEMGSLAPLNNGNPRDQNLLGQMPQPTERHFATETRQRPNPQMHQQQPAYPHNPQVFQLGSPPNPQSSGATPKTSQASQKNGLFPFSFK
ncbi:MAG: hypothetical protein VX438_13635, partial [Planctomycetota bacterium]|nr:hypothetical protein [Planctomycetota bacterium]